MQRSIKLKTSIKWNIKFACFCETIVRRLKFSYETLWNCNVRGERMQMKWWSLQNIKETCSSATGRWERNEHTRQASNELIAQVKRSIKWNVSNQTFKWRRSSDAFKGNVQLFVFSNSIRWSVELKHLSKTLGWKGTVNRSSETLRN